MQDFIVTRSVSLEFAQFLAPFLVLEEFFFSEYFCSIFLCIDRFVSKISLKNVYGVLVHQKILLLILNSSKISMES